MQTETATPNLGLPYVGPDSLPNAFTHAETHPAVLILAILKMFGAGAVAWEAETLWVEIERMLKRTPSQSVRNKIQACRTLIVTDRGYKAWDAFEACAFGLAGMPPRFDMIQKCAPFRCAFTIDVLGHVNESAVPNDEVWKYIAACFMDAGVVYAPGPLLPVNTFLQKLVGADVYQRVRTAYDNNERVDYGSALGLHVQKVRSVADFSHYNNLLLTAQLSRVMGSTNV